MVVCCHNNESEVFFGSIFYKVNVVGNNTYSTYTKMGGADVIALTRAFWFDKIKNTMVGLIQRRPTTFRRTGEMSRWRRLCMRRYVLGDVQSEDMFINGMWFLVSILYTHSVVGGVLNHTGVIYGARIQRTVALQMRLQLYTMVKYNGVINIYVWFLKIYFIKTPLVVCCYNNES